MKLNAALLTLALLGAAPPPVEAATVTGTVTLQGWNVTPIGVQLDMHFVNVSTQAVYTETFTLGLGGTYNYTTVSVIPPGTYDIYVNGDRWLQRVAPNVSVGTSATANYSLIAGDCDNDEEIGIGDYALVQAAQGSTLGSLNWDPHADLDGDGWVDMIDYSLVSFSFGHIGDTF